MSREVLRARALAEPLDDNEDGLLVTAIWCRSSHPNPPHYERCRVCHVEIDDRSVFTIRRPPLGLLRFSNGQVETLDGNLVIGRNPASGLVVNDQPTRPVVIESPDGSLSRTHAVVQIEGWQVQVVDRDSTNNTFVEIPGQPEFQLRPGEPFPIPPATRVRLGDEIEFTFEVTG
ncbi:MAG: FHA domain-containing protein [Actinobacteria bacterium]|nr:FHA domain-containing protein [Actinomycetota bacterium]